MSAVMQVRATNAQDRRRRLAFRLDETYLPAWVDKTLCRVVGRGHTPIWTSLDGPQCAWCEAKVPDDAPDTVPQQWWDAREAEKAS